MKVHDLRILLTQYCKQKETTVDDVNYLRLHGI